MVIVVAREERKMRELEQALAVRPMPFGVEQAFGACLTTGHAAERKLEDTSLPASERARALCWKRRHALGAGRTTGWSSTTCRSFSASRGAARTVASTATTYARRAPSG